jgi:hypothetical protein
MPSALPEDVLQTVASLREALDCYNKNVCQRLVFFEGTTDSRCDPGEYRQKYDQMRQRFGSHVQVIENVLSLGESLHCWLECQAFSYDAQQVRTHLDNLAYLARIVDVGCRLARHPYFLLHPAPRWSSDRLYRFLLELQPILEEKKCDWQGILPGERDVSDPMPIGVIASALGIRPTTIGKGRRKRKDYRGVRDRLKGKLIRLHGKHLYRVWLDLLHPTDAQALRDVAENVRRVQL